ncbi:MAG: rod shape-determining protein [Christensenellaceae bacterium]|nr:rod shape-determining protein [Christensenellaceae bacterium]
MGLFAYDVGIDLGTANIRLFVKGKGILVDEPSVVLISQENRRKRARLIAIGHDALNYMGRESIGERCILPLKDGIIDQNEAAAFLLNAHLNMTVGRSHLFKPRVFITYPCNTSDNNKKILRDLCISVGAGKVVLISKPFASAAGGGLHVFDAKGSMIVDMGAGTIDIAAVSLGGLAVSHSINYAGNRMNDAIIAYFHSKNKIDISWNAAESLKLDLGCAVPQLHDRTSVASGKYTGYGNQVNFNVSSKDIYEALTDSRAAIINSIMYVLKTLPPAMIPDVMEKGIYLTGGASQMPGLREFIYNELKMQVNLALEPTRSAIYGLKYIINNLDGILKQGKISFLEVDI